MLPGYLKPLSLFFRKRRNRRLAEIINQMHSALNAPIRVLDIGGTVVFWLSIPQEVRDKCLVSLLNLEGRFENLPDNEARLRNSFQLLVGDARRLNQFPDKSFDLVVCNSVIEHVGTWVDMEMVAEEAKRVGKHGWVQVPAFEFPIEQHFLIPFLHWFADSIQVSIVGWLHRTLRNRPFRRRQIAIHHVRPLSRAELSHLLPETHIHSEWLIFPKSHVSVW